MLLEKYVRFMYIIYIICSFIATVIGQPCSEALQNIYSNYCTYNVDKLCINELLYK
jgi:hypothetical protein